MADALKHMFDAPLYRRLEDDLAALAPRFDRKRFLALTTRGLAGRSLLERLHQTTLACDAALPGGYEEKLEVLYALAPRIGHNFVAIFLADFVGTFGLDNFDRSMEALRFFTPFGSSEFAVRAFIERDQPRALAVMKTWAKDPDEHVRRLASEGSRPRLPWGRRLHALVREPAPTFPILTRLRNDPSLYVRKSVANHLNDISKDHPERMLALLESWNREAPRTRWIVRHAVRTLVKRGNPGALRLIGVHEHAHLDHARISAEPAVVMLGESVTLTARLASGASADQRIVIDYVIHYARGGERTSAKVFKWKEVTLAPGEVLQLTKRQVMRDFSTRRHHPGRHRVELQINGRLMATHSFFLHIPDTRGNLARRRPPRTVGP